MRKVLIVIATAILFFALTSCMKENPANISSSSDSTVSTEPSATLEEKERQREESAAVIKEIIATDSFTDRPLEGLWYYEFSEGMYTKREEISFNADKTFSVKSTLTDGIETEENTVSGYYIQEYNSLTMYFVEDGIITNSVWMMVFTRQHEDHRNLYLMMTDGAFVYYRMDVPGEPEPAPKPEGFYWNTYCWEEDRELYMTLDFDRCEVTMLYKNVESSEPYKIVPFYMIGDSMYWVDGHYRLEAFREGPIEYLFATDGENHSSAWKEIDQQILSIEEAFPDAELEEILKTEPVYHDKL